VHGFDQRPVTSEKVKSQKVTGQSRSRRLAEHA
jgi:hypothetical protein